MKKEYRDSDSLDAESLLSNNTSTDQADRIRRNNAPRKFPTLALVAILIVTHLCVALAAALVTHQFYTEKTDVNAICAKVTSHNSPATTDVGIKWAPVTYNGSFFHQTIYRQDASPEVDAAWTALGVDYRPLRIHNDEAAESGITIDHVKIKEEYGGGYPANMEGLHHLHCLNLLRQGLVYNYDYYKAKGHGAFSNEEPIVKYHISTFSKLLSLFSFTNELV
jgi:hypothetical protein